MDATYATCTTYIDYKNFGYSLIPEEDFKRYSDMAERTVKKFVKNKNININKRCVCEIADLLYSEHNQLNRPIASFTNDKYKEQYFGEKSSGVNERIWEIVRIYFTREELCRGV